MFHELFPASSFTFYNLFVTSLLFISVAAAVRRFSRRSNRPPPPGPPGEFILGNARQIPEKFGWLYYQELAKSYGDVVHITALGQPIVALNSPQAISDVMGKKGSLVSGRPLLTFLGDLVGWYDSVIFGGPSRSWQAQRKLLHHFLGAPSMPMYHSIVEEEARAYCSRVIPTNEGFMDEFIVSMAKLILRIAYGINPKGLDDPLITMAHEVAENFEYSLEPGRFLVDTLPFLRHLPSWLPGAGFLTLGMKWRKQFYAAMNAPFEQVQADMASGKEQLSFTARCLEDRPPGVDEEYIKLAAGSLYVAASRTTMATIGTFFLAMIMHPDVQQKAQAEIDREIGQDRLPALSDRPNLLYIESLFKEVLRWHPVAPLALPHRTTEEIHYRDWTIPKNSIVYGNVWTLSHDPSVYPNPEKFDPDRYTRDPDVKDPREYVFGFGRRTCPGQAFAEATAWTIMVTLLATNHLKRALDKDGKEIAVSEDYTHAIVHNPHPFPYRFEARSAHLMSLLETSVHKPT
ncbi:cytochrome P450 [Clavulina sp. PMI_390]|nr:cytochrome P450 [Clavulina sp. PMI_390]